MSTRKFKIRATLGATPTTFIPQWTQSALPKPPSHLWQPATPPVGQQCPITPVPRAIGLPMTTIEHLAAYSGTLWLPSATVRNLGATFPGSGSRGLGAFWNNFLGLLGETPVLLCCLLFEILGTPPHAQRRGKVALLG